MSWITQKNPPVSNGGRRNKFVENQFITHSSLSFYDELVNDYIYWSNAYYIAGAFLAQHESAFPSLAHNDFLYTWAHSFNKGPHKSKSGFHLPQQLDSMEGGRKFICAGAPLPRGWQSLKIWGQFHFILEYRQNLETREGLSKMFTWEEIVIIDNRHIGRCDHLAWRIT